MSPGTYIYRIEAKVGPADVFRILQSLCDHPSQRRHEPAFEFDWLKRRIALTANSKEGLADCAARFLDRMRKLTGEGNHFLAGAVEETTDGRFLQPFGVAIQEPELFAQLLGQTLIELGVRNVRATESEGVCRVAVPAGGLVDRQADVTSLIEEFPVPGYIQVIREQ